MCCSVLLVSTITPQSTQRKAKTKLFSEIPQNPSSEGKNFFEKSLTRTCFRGAKTPVKTIKKGSFGLTKASFFIAHLEGDSSYYTTPTRSFAKATIYQDQRPAKHSLVPDKQEACYAILLFVFSVSLPLSQCPPPPIHQHSLQTA